jgi:probable rRNA maturation factor
MSRAIVTISIGDVWWSRIPKLKSQARRAVLGTLSHVAHAQPVEIAIRFASDEEMAALNLDWRGKAGPTNVLSFPAPTTGTPPGEPRPLGDIALASGVVAKEAREQGKTLEAHTVHLVVHGLLHLLGFDHGKARDAERMERAEVAILAAMGYENPYDRG